LIVNRGILVAVALLLLLPATASTDELEDYIEHVREVRMAAMAEGQVRTVASILLGYSTLTFKRDEASGQYWGTFTSTTCASPDADPEVVRRETEARNVKMNELLLELHSLADLDGSGFVTDQEATTFRKQVEAGFLAAQLASEGPVTVKRVADALGVSDAVAEERLSGYALMYPVFFELDLASDLPGFGAPPVQEIES
jgi:hypothetical protein